MFVRDCCLNTFVVNVRHCMFYRVECNIPYYWRGKYLQYSLACLHVQFSLTALSALTIVYAEERGIRVFFSPVLCKFRTVESR